MTAGMFCIILFLIDGDDWWSTLAEVLVGFIDGMILNLPPDRIFQTFMSVTIIDIYVGSVSKVLLPLHGCWEGLTHVYNMQYSCDGAFQYVF